MAKTGAFQASNESSILSKPSSMSEVVKKRGRPRKEDVIIVDHSNQIICTSCSGLGVYEAGFKWWKTCPKCRGDRYIEKE